MGAFLPYADEKTCRVTRGEGDKLELSPAEVIKATHLVGIALGMESMPALPSHITNSPFVIRFFPEEVMRLEREDGPGSLPFSWDEGDSLIVALQQSQDIAVDERKLIKSPRGHGAVNYPESPL